MQSTSSAQHQHKKYEGLFSFPSIWKEKRYARETSIELIKLYAEVKTKNPQFSAYELYEKIVALHMNISNEAAKIIVRRAEDSFASWPYDRDLKFNDVVHYMVINNYIDSHDIDGGLGPHFKEIVEEIVPRHF